MSKLNPRVLILPLSHETTQGEEYLGEKFSPVGLYSFIIQGNNVILYSNGRLPNLIDRQVYHVFLESQRRIYHVRKMRHDPGVLRMDLANSWLIRYAPKISLGQDYQYASLQTFGFTCVNPEVLVAIEIAAE